jgi:hypothetical protein
MKPRFVDCDMLMRFVGGGVGHQAVLSVDVTHDDPMDELQEDGLGLDVANLGGSSANALSNINQDTDKDDPDWQDMESDNDSTSCGSKDYNAYEDDNNRSESDEHSDEGPENGDQLGDNNGYALL